MLIALAATVLVAASWMLFLRPRAVESTTSQVTAPARVADKARQAAAATDKASAATDAASDDVADATASTPAKPAQSTPAPTEAPKAAAKKAAAPAPAKAAATPKPVAKPEGEAAVLADLDAHKVVVLLFWDRAGADDRAAHDAVEALSTHDGKVAIHAVPVQDVGRYESVTQGVNVAQSPTTIVISRDAKARSVAGLTDPTEVEQLVREALADK
jgi:hypothetical protein